MSGLYLRNFLTKEGINFSDLSKRLGFANEQRIYSLFSAADVKSGTLEKIAAALEKEVAWFYQGEKINGSVTSGHHNVAAVNSTVSVGKEMSDPERIEFLEKLLEEKERTIQILLSQHATQL